LGVPGIEGKHLDTLDSLANPARIAGIAHVVFKESPQYAHRKTGLRNNDTVAFGTFAGSARALLV
jgi:hypothetical protein